MTTHKHVADEMDTKCVEISDSICMSPVSDGFFIHFDPPAEMTDFRQIGHVTVGPNGWTQTGTLAGGDLTLAPSIKVSMPIDGRDVELIHGFVRNGKWVPA